MTKPGADAEAKGAGGRFRLPDIPEKAADHAAAVFDVFYRQAAAQELLPLLGDAETTLITGGRYVIPHPGADTSRIPYPHLMVARNVDVARFKASTPTSSPSRASPRIGSSWWPWIP